MKRDVLILLALFVVMAVAAACTPAETAEINKIDPPLPLNANTTHKCWDGRTCMNDEMCPPPGYSGAGCQIQIDDGPGDPYSAGKKRRGRLSDAGARIRMIDDDAGTPDGSIRP